MKKLKSFFNMLNDLFDPTTVSKYVWIMLSWIVLLAGDIVLDQDKIGATICVVAMLFTTVDFVNNMQHKCKNSKE